MIILYCTDSLTTGGTEQQLVELVSRLDRGRFEPYVLCLYGQRAGRSLHFLETLLRQNVPVCVLDVGWSTSDKVLAAVAIVREVWRIRPQILHMVNYHGNLLARLVRPFLPRPLRLVGSVYVEYTPKQLLYERLSGWLCAAIVCNSAHLQEQLNRIVSPQRVCLIPNGVDVARFARNPDPTLRDRLAPSAQRVLLVIGRVSRQKAPHLVVEALGLLKQRGQLPLNVVVWIVGECEDVHAQAQLEGAVRRYDLATVVQQFPATALPEVYYHAADVTVLASLWEGLPNVVIESLAAGIPVVVSEAANTAGVIEHNVNGWIVRTGDVDHLAERLRAVLDRSDDDLQAMGAACQESASLFSVESMVHCYELLYESLTAFL